VLLRESHSHGGSVCSGHIPGGSNGGPTHSSHFCNGCTGEGRPGGGPSHTALTEDGGICEGGPNDATVGGTPRGRSTHGRTYGGVFRGVESIGGRSLDELTGNKIPVHHMTRPEMHAQTDNRGSSSLDSGEAMRNRVLERTIRRLEKQVQSLTTTCSAYRKQLIDGSLVATGVYNMLQTASFCQGGEESRKSGVDPTSCSQIVDRSAGSAWLLENQ